MKKLLTCFFAIAICAPGAFAAGGGVSRVMPSDSGTTKTTSSLRSTGTVSRSTVRAPSAKTPEVTPTATTVRGTVSRVFSGTPAPAEPGNVTQRTNVVSRSGVISRSVMDEGLRTERVATSAGNASGRRNGVSVRPTTTAVGGRAEIGNTGMQTGSNIDNSMRNIRGRAAAVTAEGIEEAKNILEQTASLNKSCQEQYNECMDQFCAVIDANQKRCSCSANITQYAKVESAVKDANTQLNEVAQRIRYVGLSADEIRAIMNETEAEEALSGSEDVSETRSMLEEIEDLIRDPKISSGTYNEGASFGLDLDLDFSSDSSDMFSLDFLSGDGSGSFSNLRGAELYKAAKKRCSTVISQCKNAGATANQITGNYDLAIDKDCVAYEQGLNKMNDTLRSNVRSANLMLQKARLAVLQNKNKYDAKGCIAALDTCMKDDMVCGDNYYKCIDPTKVYIDENGEVVLGQNISDITAFMQNYNNASINDTFLETANSITISKDSCNQDGDGTDKNPKTNDGKCVVKYLLSKIGTGAKTTDGGLCRAVLDKCQAYTYQNDAYQPYNDIVVNYIQRAMVNIRAAQQQIISDYASNCMVDIANCYNQQVNQLNSWSSSSSIKGVYNVMRGACRNVALTCAYAVFDADTASCPDDDTCIESISEMFYNSLLCEDGEIYKNGECVNPNNQVSYHYNDLATDFSNTDNRVKLYLINNQVYNLPLWTDLEENSLNNMRKGCYRYKHSWCYRVTDTSLKCIPFATYTANSTDGTCVPINTSDPKFNVTDKTRLYIPAADVNEMINRGDMNVYLSITEDGNTCKGNSFTIFDEKGCRCRKGLAQDSSSAEAGTFCEFVPPIIPCPDGYIKATNDSCYKDGITMEKVSY